MILPAVFTVSLSSLCYEVLLTRFFSYSQWNHLSFMVISIVLFGFGASGTVLSLVERRRPGWSASFLESRGFPLTLVVCSITISGSFLSVKNIPLDYFRMPVEWLQGVYLLLTFLLLLIPFFCAGSLISLAFAGRSARSGWIYFASMLGSAVGALLPAALLPLLGEGRIVFCCALLPLLLPVLQITALRRGARRERQRRPAGTGLILAACAAVFLFTGAPLLVKEGTLLEISPSPYKLLPQVLQFPDTEIVSRSNTIRGRLDRLESPYIRFAPGLSLKFSGLLPEAEFLVRDGDALLVLYDLPGEATAEATAEGEARPGYFGASLQCYAGYSIRPAGRRETVLILQSGGGLSLPCAAAAGAGQVTLLLEQPGAAALYRSVYAGERQGTAVRVVAGNLRRRLARDGQRYDRIQVEAWGPSVPGMASLNQEHLLTVEAFADYLEHLRPEGVLILSRKLLLPPSDMLKIFAAAYRGLESTGIEDPAAHMVLIRGWDSYTLLGSPAPFTVDELAAVRGFCARYNFDLVFYDGIEPGEANRFNVFAEPFHYQEIQVLRRALREGSGGDYFRSYYLEVSPARDDRPFHSRFTRWSKLRLLFRSTGSRFYSLFLSGETIVLVVLIIAGLLSLVLLLLPRIAVRRRAVQIRSVRSAAGIVYFLAAGAGFMFVEMAFLQGFTFVFGDPVIAFTVVLAELLILSGVGGAVSAHWERRFLVPVLILLVLCQVLLFALFARSVQLLLQAGPVAQALGALGLLAPIALLMGVPFPVGLRLLAPSSRIRAFGWGANGVASVMASILAIPLTMVWGFSRLLLLGALCYTVMLGVSILRD